MTTSDESNFQCTDYLLLCIHVLPIIMIYKAAGCFCLSPLIQALLFRHITREGDK